MLEPILETERLRLRRLQMSDTDDMLAVLGDPVSMRYYPAPFDRAGCAVWIEKQLQRYDRDGFALWAVELKSTGEFVGDCGPVLQIVEGRSRVELGWHVKPSLQGRGLATEAAATCRDHSFTQLDQHQLISMIRPVNVPSRRVAEKIGMSIEKQVFWRHYDHYIYAIDRPGH